MATMQRVKRLYEARDFKSILVGIVLLTMSPLAMANLTVTNQCGTPLTPYLRDTMTGATAWLVQLGVNAPPRTYADKAIYAFLQSAGGEAGAPYLVGIKGSMTPECPPYNQDNKPHQVTFEGQGASCHPVCSP
jgi:hypothetical protein